MIFKSLAIRRRFIAGLPKEGVAVLRAIARRETPRLLGMSHRQERKVRALHRRGLVKFDEEGVPSLTHKGTEVLEAL